ncbi:hypothetical protein VNO78_31263 [Psophocarpus tetragonolobus]|uniref:Uncharacterized protein n=1 Tax=Psophocarpus tetragonolobus TaxID=3891 RepID=A0AAN9RY43_PSOTE
MKAKPIILDDRVFLLNVFSRNLYIGSKDQKSINIQLDGSAGYPFGRNKPAKYSLKTCNKPLETGALRVETIIREILHTARKTPLSPFINLDLKNY